MGQPQNMDNFMSLLSTTDIKKKLTVGMQLLNYLEDSTKSIECQDIGLFVDNLIPWLNNGNPKVIVFPSFINYCLTYYISQSLLLS